MWATLDATTYHRVPNSTYCANLREREMKMFPYNNSKQTNIASFCFCLGNFFRVNNTWIIQSCISNRIKLFTHNNNNNNNENHARANRCSVGRVSFTHSVHGGFLWESEKGCVWYEKCVHERAERDTQIRVKCILILIYIVGLYVCFFNARLCVCIWSSRYNNIIIMCVCRCTFCGSWAYRQFVSKTTTIRITLFLNNCLRCWPPQDMYFFSIVIEFTVN